jgi:predicted glycoside hydrolase/deacetylase ChbG (UPF0249 family)
MRKLIVNADDYGRDKDTTCATLDLFRLGSISSASLIPITKHSKIACRLAVDAGLPIGVHIVLCSELKYRGHYETILGGDLPHEREALSGMVYEEAAAQIERVLGWGVEATHMDFHMWAIPHYDGKFADVVDRLYDKFKIRPVLFPKQGQVKCDAFRSRRRIGGKTLEEKKSRLGAYLDKCDDGSLLGVHVSMSKKREPIRYAEYLALKKMIPTAHGVELWTLQ